MSDSLHNSQENLMPALGWKPLGSNSSAISPGSTHGRSPSNSHPHPLDNPEVKQTPVNQPKRVSNAPYSFDCPAAPNTLKLIDAPYRNIDEFKHITYTPVLCQPEHFTLENKYSLRQNRTGRNTELLIAITMYNESDEFLSRTLSSVFKNIRYFCEMNKRNLAPDGKSEQIGKGTDNNTFLKPSNRSNAHLESGLRGDQLWNDGAWQKIVVVIISDGRGKINERTKKMLQAMGIFQEELIMPQIIDPCEQDSITPKDVTAHLFETTCQIVVDRNQEIKSGTRQGVVPVQVLFCLKEKNAKKLNSHKWLFRAFAPLLNPYVCVLIDVGTRPKTDDAIYHLWKAFDRNLSIAGAAGEICVMLGKNCSACKNILHPMVASQNFEYKMSNILDKSLESCFGYISVLPGAFSAYRWEALQDSNAEKGPLISYFKGETPNPKGNVFASNMYLAEDRILCFELVAKRDSKWLLHYVKDARAETDVPTGVAEFISQRRRWLNGTFFCQIYALAHISRVWQTKHSFLRKLSLTIEFIYFTLTLIFSWFGLANFYLAFYLLTTQTVNTPGGLSSTAQELIFYVLRVAYLCVMIAQFICALGNRPQGAESIFIGSMFIFSIIMIFMFVMTGILIYQSFANLQPGQTWISNGGTSRDIIIAMLSTYGVYAFSSIIYGEFSHIVTCIFQYMMLLPSYVNTLTIYAFCNSHDVSWGTKGDNKGTLANVALKKPLSMEEARAFAATKSEPPGFSEKDLNRYYQNAVSVVQTPPPEEVDIMDPHVKREDYYKNFRTWFVLFWVLTNGLLVAIISSPQLSAILTGSGNANFSNPYMQFIMYSVAFFAVIRLFGCILYLILRMTRRY